MALTKEEVELDRQMKEIMKAREEMIKSLFDDSSSFQNMDRMFQDMIKRFDRESFGSDTSSIVGEYDWRETPKLMILVLKVKQIKNKPLDIKIEKGQIKLKGDVESIDTNKNNKRITKVHFERSFSIPDGVDETTPEFENNKGELLIKFKKLKTAEAPGTRKLLPKDADDVTI